MRAPTLIPIAFVCCVALVACGDEEVKEFNGATPILAGTTMTTPALDGSWVITSTPAVGACGALNVLFQPETVLTIVQAGNSIQFSLTDGCGRPVPGGEGTVDAGRMVELSALDDHPLTPTCTLRVKQVKIGLVETPANEFAGSDDLTIEGSTDPGANDCDPSLPCSVTGTFTAARCPRSGCQVTCAP